MLVEAFVAKPSIEALRIGVFDGLSGPDEAQSDAALISPCIRDAAGELRPIVHGDRCLRAALGDYLVEFAGNPRSDDRGIDDRGNALPGEVIDDGKAAKAPTVGQRVGYVYAEAEARLRRVRHWVESAQIPPWEWLTSARKETKRKRCATQIVAITG